MITENDEKGAAVKFPPPLVYLIVILTTYGVHYFWPIGIGNLPVLKYIGAVAIVLGFCVVIVAYRSFEQAETHILPWKPTTKIVSTGIYRYSRNPMYAGFCLVQIGIGIFVNSLWILITFIVSAFVVYEIAIKKEEGYLETKFGEEYVQYRNNVRRWM